MSRVLLLGGTGAVGKSCLGVLARQDDASVVIAGRDEGGLREVAGDAEVVRLDATDQKAVTAAAAHCDVVINCAGPSALLSAQVAHAAIDAGVPYVDPGGDQALLDDLASAPVRVVLQTGVQPGLSGLLLRILDPHPADDVTAWCGGLQQLTPASVLEYLASLRDPRSHPGAVLRDGAIRRIAGVQAEPAPQQYFAPTVGVHPHFDAETEAVASHLGVGNVTWLNVFDGPHTTRAMQLLALEENADLSAVLAAAKLDLFGRRTYFAIVATTGSATVAFTCPDSYRVTGALAAFAACHLPEQAGAQPFWRTDQPRRVLDFVRAAVPEVSFVEESPLVEEGCL